MRILIVHNHYGDFAIGGEAMVMKAEAKLLRSKGHNVFVYERTNAEIAKRSLWRKIKTFWNVTWSPEGYKAVAEVIDEFKPDIMHVHNYWLLLSPSIFAAAKERGVATVCTLHNYRLICPSGQFLYRNKPCEQCFDGGAMRVLYRRCYPGKSLLKSLLSFRLYKDTKNRNFLSPYVDVFIALSEFGRSKFIEGGLPAGKIFVKPNFISDPLDGKGISDNRKGAIFIGRLSHEKGVETLIQAWQNIDYPLTIIGDGPDRDELEKMATDNGNINFLGQKTNKEAIELLNGSAFMVFPSIWYEGFPISLLESMALGRAVIASDLGARREIVSDGETGVLFESGNAKDLCEKIQLLINSNSCSQMGLAARQRYLKKYTPDVNYDRLMEIYRNL